MMLRGCPAMGDARSCRTSWEHPSVHPSFGSNHPQKGCGLAPMMTLRARWSCSSPGTSPGTASWMAPPPAGRDPGIAGEDEGTGRAARRLFDEAASQEWHHLSWRERFRVQALISSDKR